MVKTVKKIYGPVALMPIEYEILFFGSLKRGGRTRERVHPGKRNLQEVSKHYKRTMENFMGWAFILMSLE